MCLQHSLRFSERNLGLPHWRQTVYPLSHRKERQIDTMHHLMGWNMKNRASFCGIPSRDKQPKSLQNRASLVAQRVKNWPAMWRPGFDPWVRKNSWRRAWQPTPVFMPGEFPWTEEPAQLQSMGSQELDIAEQLSTAQHRQLNNKPV